MIKIKISRSKETKILKEHIEKVGYCEACGVKNDSLVIHHLQKKLSHPELRFEPSNWIVLCYICHSKTENGLNTKQFNDYLKEIKNTNYLLDNVGNCIKRLSDK